MDLAKLSDRVTDDLCSEIGKDLPAAKRDAMRQIIQEALRDATQNAHRQMKETVLTCCGPDADLAHKIQEQMSKKRDMLVANLMAMR